jgi:deoxyribonuclease V
MLYYPRPVLTSEQVLRLDEAKKLQQELRSRVSLENDFGQLRTIAGIDVSHTRDDFSHAAIVLLDAQSLKQIGQARVSAPTDFPYVPGFLSFREIPVILQALEKLPQWPDLLMVDGQGVAHPRRLGIAAHLGVMTRMPSIGVAKSRLTGRYEPLGEEKFDQADLMDKNEKIGTVLRSKANCLPLFISPGHRVDHDTAVALTLMCLTRYRLPEPTRLADKLSKAHDVKAA